MRPRRKVAELCIWKWDNQAHRRLLKPGKPLLLRCRVDAMGYTVALGLPELRAEIAALYKLWYDVDLDPARVVVTSGSSAGFLLAFTALFDPGARVGVAAPDIPLTGKY